LVFQIKQGEIIPGTHITCQEGPVKGKYRCGVQDYRRFQNRPNGAGLPGGIVDLFKYGIEQTMAALRRT